MNPIQRTLLEVSLVLASGIGVGLLGNGLSADGLDLGRDYFPSAAHSTADEAGGQAGDVPNAADVTPAGDPDAQEAAAAEPVESDEGADEDLSSAVVARLAEKGLRAISFAETRTLFEDPTYEYEAYLFIDARDAEHYAEGHIPGARQFNPYYPERTLDEILPLLGTSAETVVYCTGGDCEDSESAAIFLINMGAPAERLRVFTGGITRWRDEGLPIERGARGSGQLVEETK
jgi:rhodanese-related sulfurtransferase